MHLVLPLLASILLVSGLILIKRAGSHGVGPLTTIFVTNMFSCVAFATLWVLGGEIQSWSLFWQPAVIALLFMLGLTFTFLAINLGDVSVATPVFGIKVVFVAVLLTLVGEETLPAAVWDAAVMATLGIGLIQWTGRDHPRRILMTILLALSAASCYATFDVLVQRWAPAWGAGRFLPIVYAIVGALSLGMIGRVEWEKLRDPSIRRVLVAGAVLVALQSVCIVVAIAMFGDAARINVVYAMRGLWGVILAWAAAKVWGGGEATLTRSALLTRLTGAAVLTAAVVFVILSR